MACSCLISTHRTANPSIALLSQGGLSRSATMSSPRTRPRASRIGIFSMPKIGVAFNTICCASCSCVRPSVASVAFTISPPSVRLRGGNFYERSTFLAERFDLVGNIVKALRRRRVRIKHCKGLTRIRLDHDIRVEGNAPEEGHAHINRGGFPAAFAKHLDVAVAMGAL